MLTAAGHAHGWPVAEGGSASHHQRAGLAAGRARAARSSPGTGSARARTCPRPGSRCSTPARRRSRRSYGDDLPGRTRRAYRRCRYGPAAFKVDLAVRGGVPWTNEAARRAGTVHLGGTLEEIAEAEAAICAGRMPERPFVLVGPAVAGRPRTRAAAATCTRSGPTPTCRPAGTGRGSRWCSTSSSGSRPGLRDRVVATAVRTPADLAADNPNYVGGDIVGGANDLRQLRGPPDGLAADPYATGLPGLLPVLVGDPARRRRPRHVRLPRGEPRSALAHSEQADRLDRLVDLVGVGGDARPEPDVRRGVRRRAAHHALSRSLKTNSGGGWPATSKQTMPAERSGDIGVLRVSPAMPASPSLSRVACSAVRATSRSRPIAHMNAEGVRGRPAVLEGVVAAGGEPAGGARRVGERRDHLGQRPEARGPRGCRCRAARTATCGCPRRGSRSPRSGRSTSTALNPCTPSTQTTYWLRGTLLSPSRAAQISATGTRTPVEECTQVSATTLVRGVIPPASALDHLVHGGLRRVVVQRDLLDASRRCASGAAAGCPRSSRSRASS